MPKWNKLVRGKGIGMDIKALRYFVELVNQRSFTRASEKLFVTQPTISKMIKQLENAVGQPLLQRDGRQFTLTQAGDIVYVRAQQILENMAQLRAELADLEDLHRGQLHLGIPPMVGHLYADLIRQFRQRYPKIELTIAEYGGRKIEQAILSGELDVAMTMLSTNHQDLLTRLPLDHYSIHAVVPAGKGWEAYDTISWQSLINEPFYLYTEEFTLSDRIHEACDNEGFSPQIAARSSQWDFLVALVKSGVGVAFLPEPLCNNINDNSVIHRAISPSIDWNLGAVWHTERYVSRTAEAWIRLCIDYLERERA